MSEDRIRDEMEVECDESEMKEVYIIIWQIKNH